MGKRSLLQPQMPVCCTKGLLSCVCPILPLHGLCSSHCLCRGSSLLTPNLSVISKLCMNMMICLVHSRVLGESPRWIDFSSIWGIGFYLGLCFKDYLWIKRKRVTNWTWSGRGKYLLKVVDNNFPLYGKGSFGETVYICSIYCIRKTNSYIRYKW